jgi:ABC-type lipoprotein export system ATPase subunit
MNPILEFQSVFKTFPQADGGDRRALENVSFQVPENNAVALVGRSGSGKSTLLNLASGIDVPSRGIVRLDQNDLGSLSEHDRTLLRRRTVGIVFQFFHLLPHLTVEDNIALPEWIDGNTGQDVVRRTKELLGRVGLEDRAGDSIQKLSGGEMQRVAICRALLRRPRLVLADEPTGNLDDENARMVMDLLLDLAREESSALLYVTHSDEMASLADQVWHIHSGSLETT